MYISKRVGVLELAFYRWQLLTAVALTVTLSTVLYLELLDRYLALPLSVVSALGTAISFFIAFFTAQAYERWWEARKVWGSLVNDSRSFARMVNTYFPDSEGSSEVAVLQDRLVRRHIAFLYALRDFLREQNTGEHTRYLAAKDGDRIQDRTIFPTLFWNFRTPTLTRRNALVGSRSFGWPSSTTCSTDSVPRWECASGSSARSFRPSTPQ